jgi:hypothetical protein
MSSKVKHYLRKTLKIFAWIIGSIIGLVLLVLLLLQIPFIQNKVKDRAVVYLEDKIGTDVDVERLTIDFPKKVVLEGVYFEGQNGDTLLAGERLAVDISLMKLLSNKVEINSIDLRGIYANITRDKDSVFNFDYILDAFAGKTPKDTTAAPMEFSLDRVNLDRIRIKFNDQISKNDLVANLNHFDTRVTKFNLEKQEFEIPKVKMDGLKVVLKQGLVGEIAQNTQEIAEEASKKPDVKIKLGQLDFTNIDIGYDSEGSHLDTGMKLDKLLVEFNEIDLKQQLIDVENFELNGLKGQLAFTEYEKQVQEALPEQTAAVANAQWKIKLANADIKDVAFKFDDANFVPVNRGIDYKHLDVTGFNLEAKEFAYSPETISAEIANFSMSEKSGAVIEEFRGRVFYGPKGAELRDFYLETPRTLLRDDIVVAYPSVETVSKDLSKLSIDANLQDSHVSFQDILIFAPQLANTPPFKGNANEILYIDGSVEGSMADLYIQNLSVSGFGNTAIAASGRVRGLPDVNKAYFDLNIRQFRTTSRDIKSLLPVGTLPPNINIPPSVAVNGRFTGTINNFNTNMNLSSSYGGAKVVAAFDQRVKGRERYDANVNVNNFDLGTLISNDSIGRVTLTAKVKGTGLDPQTANATVVANVIRAEFNGYNYKDLNLNGNISNGRYDVVADMDDPNIDFDLQANGGFKDKYPNGKIKLNVDIADLEKLNLHAGPLKMRGNLDADFTDGNPDNLNGIVTLHHFMFNNGKEQFALDSINIAAVSTPDRNEIAVRSQILNASIIGKYQLTQVGTALSNSIANYYNTTPGKPLTPTAPQNFTFTIRVNDDPIWQKLMPQIERLEPIDINGRYNSVGDTIVLNGLIPRVVYGPYTITNGIITVNTENEALAYNVIIDEVQSEQLVIHQTTIVGTLKEDLLDYRLEIMDRKDQEQYMIAGIMKAGADNTELSLNPDGLMLNYEPWTIEQDNVLRFGKNGIYANNFVMSREGASLSAQSQSEAPNAPLNVELENFQIATLTNMVQKEELKLNGTINGNAELRNLAVSPVFTSDLTIANFAIAKDTVGDIRVRVDNLTANTYTADVEITGQGNVVNLDGTYNAASESFNLNLDMQKLNIASVQAFTFGQVSEGTGYISGDFKITGTVADPDINGSLKFNDAGFRVTTLNSYFTGMENAIVFNDSGITFNNFYIEDEKANQLILDGNVATTDYKNFNFDLTLDADNFRAMNSTSKDNELFYGNLFLDTHLDITGNQNIPVIDGDIRINEETEFTVVLPQQDPSIADREGIVEFIDQDNIEMQQRIQMEEAFNEIDVKGLDVSVNIEIVKEAVMNIVVDKGTGDFLQLQGEAQLTGGIDPSGKTTLTGRYEFTEGAYEMSFNFIRRRFEIEAGSYILWTGEPTAATVSVTAIYETEAAPIDLVDDQLGSVSPSIRNTYKQKIPFHTLLKINGELLRPELTFDIVVPEGNHNVSTEILNNTKTKLEQIRQQPSELNKQVFALLLLNRFIGENPFASESGGDSAGSIARQSVSKILSEQLNNLAGNLIQGFELNFDLESIEDYSTGEMQNRTDLNVAISKRLLDDRINVTVGSSFGVEGETAANEEANNIAGDISVDYQLTKDGRYLVRAYRKDEYQIALQGQVVETGVSFIITMDYNKFRELFHRTEEEKEARRKEKERKEREKQKEEEKNRDQKHQLPPNTVQDE